MRLDLQDVSVTIGQKQIVKRTTIRVAEGTVAGVLGPNGSGKSTLLRTIYRIVKPCGGTVLLDDRDVWRTDAGEIAKYVAAVCQNHETTYDLTVGELVRLGRTPHKSLFEADNERDDQAVACAMREAGIDYLAERRMSELSGGERQRAVIAMGLAQEPKLLVLDEPTNHLDVRRQIEVLNFVKRLKLTTVVALHDLNLAAEYCDELTLLVDGSVVAFGTPEETLKPEIVRQAIGMETVRGINPLTGRPHVFFGYSLSSQ